MKFCSTTVLFTGLLSPHLISAFFFVEKAQETAPSPLALIEPTPEAIQREKYAANQIDLMYQRALNATLAQLDADVAVSRARGIEPNCTRETLRKRIEL